MDFSPVFPEDSPYVTVTDCDDFWFFHFFLDRRNFQISFQHSFFAIYFPTANQILIFVEISQKLWKSTEIIYKKYSQY